MLTDMLQDSEIINLIAEVQELRAKVAALYTEIAELNARINLFHKQPLD